MSFTTCKQCGRVCKATEDQNGSASGPSWCPACRVDGITLKTKSLEQWFDERLIKAGYERQADGSLVKDSDVCGVPMRHTLRRVDGGYTSDVDFLCGVKVLDIDDDLRDYFPHFFK